MPQPTSSTAKDQKPRSQELRAPALGGPKAAGDTRSAAAFKGYVAGLNGGVGGTKASGPPGGPTGRGGPETNSVLDEDALDPVQARTTGPEMFINDNPETFRKPGVLGSTMAPIPGRGDTTHTFTGSARFFALAQNGTGHALTQQLLIKNAGKTAQTFEVKGTVFANKGVTKTDGRIQQGYKRDGKFQGPQAIAASSYLDAKPGSNGFLKKSVTVQAGSVGLLNAQYHECGAEVFILLEITSSDPKGAFQLANVATEKALDEKGRNAVASGKYQAAGDPASDKDFASADGAKMGRPNGVISAGSIVQGGREIELKPGQRVGDLVMATDTRNSKGDKHEIATIDQAMPNPKGRGTAATQNDGNYGMEYQLAYTLVNPTGQKLKVGVFLTAPKQRPGDELRPDGGAITMPVEIDGKRVEVRVNARGVGVRLTEVEVGPNARRGMQLRWVHMGNTFPPAGVEFRAE